MTTATIQINSHSSPAFGVLEKISSKVDLPWFVIELNLKNKKMSERTRIINEIEKEVSDIGYNYNRIFSKPDEEGIYHLHFVRGEPNA